MKTYEARKKETCEWCALNKEIIFDPLMKPMHRLAPSSSFARDYRPCTALSHEDYEAELRAEIEKLRAYGNEMGEQLEHDRSLVADCITHATEEITGRYWLTEGRGPYEWNDDRWHGEFAAASAAILAAIEPMRKVAADWKGCPTGATEICQARLDLKMRAISLSDEIGKLRAAFNSIATVIQGAYLNGQLPPISDAELAEKIITEYSSKRASAYEQGKRANVLELKLRKALGIIDVAPHGYCQMQNESHCQHCRKPRDRHYWDSEWAADGTCKDGRGRPERTKWTPVDPLPCGCWKSRAVAALADTASTDPDALTGCADDTIPRSNVDVMEAKLRIAVGIIEAAPHDYCQMQTEPHCQYCHKPRRRHYWDSEWSVDGTCKDERGRPEPTSWTPVDPLPCNCWKSRAVGALADTSPQPESGKQAENNARQLILSLFSQSSGSTLFYDEIAERLNLTLQQTVEVCNQLESEGLVGELRPQLESAE